MRRPHIALPKSKHAKVCKTCNRKKGVHLFYRRAGNKDGLSNECKACFKLGPTYRNQRNTYYVREYGITIEEYEEMFNEQDGRCFICGKQPRARKLAVDHDHAVEAKLEKSGVENSRRRSVRGLLCNTCNEYLGHTGDKTQPWAKGMEYLSRPLRFN